MELDSLKDDQPIQASSEDEAEVETETKDTSVREAPPQSLRKIKIQELTNQDLKEYIEKLEIKVPTNMKEIPDKFVELQTTISALTTKVDKLEGSKLEILANLVALPSQVSSISSQVAKLKVLDAIPTIPGKVAAAINRFAHAIFLSLYAAINRGDTAADKESNSDFDSESRPSGTLEELSKTKPIKKFTYIIESGKRHQMPKEEIKNPKGIKELAKAESIKSERKSGKKFLIRTLGQDVVEKVYKYKGPINLKVYIDDGLTEIIHIFKISDLHVGECRPMEERDPIIKLNLLAKRTRKNVDDLYDYFKSIKRYKKFVQYDDHPDGTVLNEPTLGMILFNAQHKKDFISIDNFKEVNNGMLYNVQEIFFRLHQGPGMDDLARTFSSLLVAEVDKRILNPNKRMRLIKHLRQ
ncbi:hypothetical protein Tco_0950320 [Tanacetum coccineum]